MGAGSMPARRKTMGASHSQEPSDPEVWRAAQLLFRSLSVKEKPVDCSRRGIKMA
jgi:hypothetical protein